MTGELKKSTLELVLANLNKNVEEIKTELQNYRKENGERLEKLICRLENHEVRISVIEDRQTPASKEIKETLFNKPYIKYPSITISAAGIATLIVELIKYFKG
jgi:seryl-tRNA synthetase